MVSFVCNKSTRIVILCSLLLDVTSGFVITSQNGCYCRDKTFGRLSSPLERVTNDRAKKNMFRDSRQWNTQLWDSLTAEQQHAKEVFEKFERGGMIDASGLSDMLEVLDIDATREEAEALFKYLDKNYDGQVGFDEFLPWYSEAADIAKDVARNFQALLIGRRTVDRFDKTPVADEVLRRAIQCAIAAPNRSMSEPWRFIQVGPKTVEKFAALNSKLAMETTSNHPDGPVVDWTDIPGWCVVTTKLSPNDPEKELDDFKSVSCAVQNFMLSMWSEGIGSKWTSGPVQKTPEFAKLCGVDTSKERVAGCIWYGFPSGGLVSADPKRRKNEVEDVLTKLP